MATNADVRSLEQLEIFLGQMERFRTELLKQIENLEVELRRLTSWLEGDAVNYWMDELKKAQRKFSETQDALSRCMSYVRSEERRPCTEEKKRVLLAKRRREVCETKLKMVKAAAAHWERERTKNQARLERCRDMADADLLVALHHLRGQLEQLATYANLRSGAVSGRSKPSATKPTESASPTAPLEPPATGDHA